MDLTFWDRLVLNLTGKLPKKTREKLDREVERQHREFQARLAVLNAEKAKRLAAIEKEAKASKPATKTAAKPATKKAAPKKKS